MIVRCPRCKHKMQYQPKQGLLTEKIKRCVYCGMSFKVHSNPEHTRIEKI